MSMRVLILLTVATTWVESASQLEDLTPQMARSEFYILAQDWLPEICSVTGSTSNACTNPQASMKHRFVLHGLSLHGPGQVLYEFCGGSTLNVTSLPSATWSSLANFWPEITEGNPWAEAWWRCGTCTQLSQLDYFTVALQMHQTTETPELREFLSSAAGKRVETSKVLSAYGSTESAVLICRDDLSLSTIYTCWSRNGTNFSTNRVACPTSVRTIQNCGSKVYVRDFPENPKQSQFATAVWLMQYTILLSAFFASWRADCRSHKTFCIFTRRTAIQILAVIHAGTGVFSELWAIALQAGGETGLTMWPWLSMTELVTNLAISVLMLHWYTLLCSSFGCAKISHAYMGAFFWIAVVLAWAVFYLKFNIQGKYTAYIKEMELNPIPYLSFSYYVINMLLELLCLRAVFKMLDVLYRQDRSRPSIKRVLGINSISAIDSVVLVIVHIPQVKEFISLYITADWHSWTLGVLFFIRYVTVSSLIEPVTNCDPNDPEAENSEITNALHFGPLLSYEFKHGKALVICNSNYAASGVDGLRALSNQTDAQRYALAFSLMGFSVTTLFDVDSEGLLRHVEELAMSAGEEKANGIGFAFSGHGGVDSIFGVDGIEVRIPELKSKCQNGEALVPKLFFLDCCRGHSMETRRNRRNTVSWEVLLTCGTGGPSANADFLVCNATVRHFTAYQQEDGSGVFTKSLCHCIEELVDKEEDHDIEDALKLAGAEVAIKKLGLCRRQCPSYESTLTRRFVLRKPRGGLAGSSSLPTSSTASGITLPTPTVSGATLLSEPLV